MKVKLRITLSEITEVDSEHYDAKTPEDIVKEQQTYFDEGDADPSEYIGNGSGSSYTCTVEIAK